MNVLDIMLLCRFVLDKGFQLHRIFCNHRRLGKGNSEVWQTAHFL